MMIGAMAGMSDQRQRNVHGAVILNKNSQLEKGKTDREMFRVSDVF